MALILNFCEKRHCCGKITFVNTQRNKRRSKKQRSLLGKILLDEKQKWREGDKNSLIEWIKWRLWNRKRLFLIFMFLFYR